MVVTSVFILKTTIYVTKENFIPLLYGAVLDVALIILSLTPFNYG